VAAVVPLVPQVEKALVVLMGLLDVQAKLVPQDYSEGLGRRVLLEQRVERVCRVALELQGQPEGKEEKVVMDDQVPLV
jgi:hypothetical protein